MIDHVTNLNLVFAHNFVEKLFTLHVRHVGGCAVLAGDACLKFLRNS